MIIILYICTCIRVKTHVYNDMRTN